MDDADRYALYQDAEVAFKCLLGLFEETGTPLYAFSAKALAEECGWSFAADCYRLSPSVSAYLRWLACIDEQAEISVITPPHLRVIQ